MTSLILILKGFLVGIGKIIPGVSGSLIAFSLGIYEKAIDVINNFFSDLKNNILFLGKIGVGVLIAILVFSKLILYFIDNYYVYTISLFIGLIAGTTPSILKKSRIDKNNILYVLLAIILIVFLYLFKNNNIYEPSNSLLDYIYIAIIGFLDMATMIIPGISGTATFMMLGCYEFVLNLFSNPFYNIKYTISFGVGLVIGIYLISKFIAFCLNKCKEKLYAIIIGFSLSSIGYLILNIIPFIKISNFIILIILFLIGYIISYFLERKE